MRTPYSLLSAIIILLGIAIGCTTKEINLITNIDFELTTSNAEGGFVKDSLTTNLVITPQSVAYPGFQYFTKYTITQGEGYFVAVDNTLIPAEEDIRLNLEDKAYAANWKYIGTTAGNHNIRIEARDNYERYKEANLVYEIKPIAVLWEVSSPQTMAQVNDTIPLTLQLENLSGVALTYERIIGINEGAGILLDADKKPIALNTPTTITAGTQTLHYISTVAGSNGLQFDLITDIGTEETTAISFDIQEILVNEAPTIVPDEAETLATIAVAIPVLDNDTDPEEDALTILAVMPPTNGTASIENNEILYTPNDAFIGKEVFTYSIMDSAGNEVTGGVITIVVSPRATIDIPDQNFEQALIALGHDEGELDGKMFQDVAERITSLDVSDKGIERLEGIAWFVSLEELIAKNNSLASIDLTNNTALTFLNIEFNEVNSIDLTKNTKLIEAILWDNKLSKIDLTKNVNLEKLDLTGNPLTELDISNNAKLSYLNSGYTNMESIDVSNNLKLEFLNLGISPLRTLDVSMLSMLESLALWNTNLKELDVSNNTNLNFLAVSHGDLTELDVSKNNRLESLWVVQTNLSTIDLSQNASLTDLRLDQNALVNADLTGLHTLEKLDITGNNNLSCIQVSDVAIAEAKTDWLKDGTAYYSLDCSQPRATIDIPDENFEQALIALGHDEGELDGKMFQDVAERITSLEVSDKGIERLEGIAWFTSLKELIANNNNITSIDLSSNILLETLDLEQNLLTTLDVNNNVRIKVLKVRNYGENKGNIFSVLDTSQLPDLEVYICHRNNLESIDVSTNIKLRELGSGWNLFSFADVSKNTELITLNFGVTPIQSIDVSNLKKLETLALSTTQLTSLDTRSNPNLKILAVPANSIASLDISNNPLLELLWVNSTEISSLDISNLNISQLDLRAENNPNLSCIQVSDVAVAEAKTDWLKDDTAYYSLDCSQPRATIDIPDQNFEQALIALGHDEGELDGKMFQDVAERITSLEVSDKGIERLEGIAWFTSLKELIANNNSIASIDLSSNILLETLDLEQNLLTTLDVNNNVRIKVLKVRNYGENKGNIFSALDTSQLPDLEVYICHRNNLESVDVSNNVKLKEFQSGWNLFSFADVSKNTELILLNFGITPIQSIDVSNLKKLETLALWHTNLSELEVSNNTNLKFLAVSQGDLTGLDVSKNNRLESLWVVQTNLATIDLSQNTSLTDLRLDQNALVNADLTGLHTLEKLDITGNSNLSCIQVSDVAVAEAKTSAGDWQKDTTVEYNMTCP